MIELDEIKTTGANQEKEKRHYNNMPQAPVGTMTSTFCGLNLPKLGNGALPPNQVCPECLMKARSAGYHV